MAAVLLETKTRLAGGFNHRILKSQGSQPHSYHVLSPPRNADFIIMHLVASNGGCTDVGCLAPGLSTPRDKVGNKWPCQTTVPTEYPEHATTTT